MKSLVHLATFKGLKRRPTWYVIVQTAQRPTGHKWSNKLCRCVCFVTVPKPGLFFGNSSECAPKGSRTQSSTLRPR